jgi:hypothetical protein
MKYRLFPVGGADFKGAVIVIFVGGVVYAFRNAAAFLACDDCPVKVEVAAAVELSAPTSPEVSAVRKTTAMATMPTTDTRRRCVRCFER